MDRGFDSFIELFIQFEVDIKVHHLQILIHHLVDEGEIFFDD